MTSAQQRARGRGRGRPAVDGDAALLKVTVALPAAMIAACRRLGEGNLSLGLRRLYSGRYDQIQAIEYDQNARYDQIPDNGHTQIPEQGEPVRRPVQPQPVHAVPKPAAPRRIALPHATSLPKSLTAWDDDEE